MSTQGSNGDRTGNGTRVMAPDLRPAYGRAVLGIVKLGCLRGRHRRVGRTRDRACLLLVLSLLLSLKTVVSVGAGMGVRRMFPSLLR